LVLTGDSQVDDDIGLLFDPSQYRLERLGALVGAPVLRIARVEMDDRGARLGSPQGRVRDFLRCYWQV
jgi:hypothetical protein